MSMGKMQLMNAVGPLVDAVAHLVAAGQSVPQAEATVCQITMDLYAWVLQAIATNSPWPDPNIGPVPPTPTPAPVPTPPPTFKLPAGFAPPPSA